MSSSEHEWLSELTADNFLALYELVLEIHSELQMGQVPRLRIMPAVVRFQQLFPANTPAVRDRYCRLRWMAAELLKQKGIVRGFQQIQGGHRWHNILEFDAETTRIDPLVEAVNEEYRRRTPSSAPPDRPSTMSTEGPQLPDKITLLWLARNVPHTGWLWFLGLLLAAVVLGAKLGQTTTVRELLGRTDRSSPSFPEGELKQRVDDLIDGHNANAARITSAIVDEERSTGAMTFDSDRRPHVEAAQRLRDLLKDEDERFQASLAALKALRED